MIRIGTRSSDLALFQANHLKDLLRKLCGVESTLVHISTQGDLDSISEFRELEGQGFFTKAIEDKLLSGEIDIAVHSMKDLPVKQPKGLCIGAVFSRADQRDVLLIRKDSADTEERLWLKVGAKVGTSSERRRAQIKALAPESEILPIRGNVPTRLRKLRDGEYDAILLAGAGLTRLGLDLSEFATQILPVSRVVPAPAQGILAAEAREDDERSLAMLAKIDDPEVRKLAKVERSMLAYFGGGCQLPLGANATYRENQIELRAFFAFEAGEGQIPVSATSLGSDPEIVAKEAVVLLHSGKVKALSANKPLLGKTVVVTGDEPADDSVRREIESLGAKVLFVRTLDFEALPNGPGLDALRSSDCSPEVFVFTSKRGVRSFEELFPAPKFREIPVASVGGSTSEACRSAGFKVVLEGDDGAERLIEELSSKLDPGANVFWIGAEESANSDLASIQNADVTRVAVYRSFPAEIDLAIIADASNADAVVATSPKSFDALASRVEIRKDALLVAIGSTTEKHLRSIEAERVIKLPFADIRLVPGVLI
ncbi:MAG: hydroxymethylbilane synthase [Planctomycetes bacterium]|nr:hydroxymethylbilane synthase [Planctomycetota bacterium]